MRKSLLGLTPYDQVRDSLTTKSCTWVLGTAVNAAHCTCVISLLLSLHHSLVIFTGSPFQGGIRRHDGFGGGDIQVRERSRLVRCGGHSRQVK